MWLRLVLLLTLLHVLCVCGSDWRISVEGGSIKGYLSFSEANTILDGFLTEYPSFVSRSVIGSSYRGRDITSYVIRVGAPQANKLLLTSVFHANEPLTLWVSLHAMGSILEALAAGSVDMTYLFSTRELHVIPFVNPDGYAEATPEGGFPYRKNRRATCASDPNLGGVDLNRNFDLSWKHVGDRCSLEYAGSAPFSEPETQALKNYAESQNFLSIMNLHAFGNILTFPYNFADQSKSLPPAHLAFYQGLQRMFRFEKFGPSISTLHYTTTGESDDWFYSELGALSMSPELGNEADGFAPETSAARTAAQVHFQRITFWLLRAGGFDASEIRLVKGGVAGQWEVTVVNQGTVAMPVDQMNITIGHKSCDTFSSSLYDLGKDDIPSLGGEMSARVDLVGCDDNVTLENFSICMHTSSICRCFTQVNDGVYSVPIGAISNPIKGLCGDAIDPAIIQPSSNWLARMVRYLILAVVVYFLARIVNSTVDLEGRIYDATAAPKGVHVEAITFDRKLSTYE